MNVFTPAMLAVLSGVATGFAVCDQWFCSVPTETLPNRAFVSAATSQGYMDDKTKKYTCPTIFGALSSANVSWSIYGYSEPPLTRQDFSDTVNADDSHFGLFTDFQAAAANGTLAVGVWRGDTFANSLPPMLGWNPRGLLAVGVMCFVLLLPFFGFREVARVMGCREMWVLFFERREND